MLRKVRWVAAAAWLCAACSGDATAPEGAVLDLEHPSWAGAAGQSLEPLRVTIRDAAGNPIPSAGGQVVVSAASGGALAGTTSASLQGGEATFTDLRVPAAGTVQLTVSWRNLRTQVSFTIHPDFDLVRFDGGSGPVALLASGRAAAAELGFEPFAAAGTSQRLLRGAGMADLTAFRPGAVPVLRRIAWTDDADTIDVRFDAPIPIPLTVWSVARPLDEVRAAVTAEVDRINREWDAEGVGLRLAEVELIDASADPEAIRFQEWLFDAEEIAGAIGHRAGRINVYLVGSQRVEGQEFPSPNLGVAVIGGSVLTLGPGALRALNHELGHNFGLLHTNPAQVGGRNVMAPGQKTEIDTYTEGQLFRIHFAAGSALSAVYGRNLDLRRPCSPNGLEDASCPAVALMVRLDPSPLYSVHPETSASAPWSCGVGRG